MVNRRARSLSYDKRTCQVFVIWLTDVPGLCNMISGGARSLLYG